MARNKDVDAWFVKYQGPMKDVMLRIRDIILGSDARIEECIKWQAPTFTYRGNLASFFPKTKQHASLMFHAGAEIPGTHPRLEGAGAKGRVLKLASVAEADAARRDIEKVIRAWCDWREQEAAPEPKRAASIRKNSAPAKKRAAGGRKVAARKTGR